MAVCSHLGNCNNSFAITSIPTTSITFQQSTFLRLLATDFYLIITTFSTIEAFQTWKFTPLLIKIPFISIDEDGIDSPVI
jgi:hypothetical protein